MPAQAVAPTAEDPNLAGFGATRELEQHHDISSRPVPRGRGHRISMVAETMWRLKQIESDVYIATERWYKDYALGVHGVREDAGEIDPSIRVSKSGYTGIGDSQLDAHTRYMLANQAVGKLGSAILHAALAESVSKSNLCRMFHWPRDHAPTALLMIFTRLAEHYDEIDSGRTSRKPC